MSLMSILIQLSLVPGRLDHTGYMSDEIIKALNVEVKKCIHG